MNTHHRPALARSAQILRFLLKYRSAGVFTGLDLDAADADPDADAPIEGKPEEFVDDLEALGPTFIKIGQALSTRPDMVPAAYLAALERMQDNVAPVPFDDDPRGGRGRTRRAHQQGVRRLRRNAARRRLAGAGASRDAARRPRGRGQGAAPGHRRA